jgi:hypothetical protein
MSSTRKVEQTIALVDQTGARVTANIAGDVEHSTKDGFAHRDCALTLSFGNTILHGSAFDFFEALCQIREQLVALSLTPLCYGASLNVYPSGMMRDMRLGLYGYKQTIGEKATRESAVRIFDTGIDIEPSTVAIQKVFHENWRKSLPC